MSKPSKSPNLTTIEKSALLELIKSKKDVIENKQNDGKIILLLRKTQNGRKLGMNLTEPPRDRQMQLIWHKSLNDNYYALSNFLLI